MKIDLFFPKDLGKETEDEIIDWMRDLIDKALLPNQSSPLKYVKKDGMEVEK